MCTPMVTCFSFSQTIFQAKLFNCLLFYLMKPQTNKPVCFHSDPRITVGMAIF